MTILHVLDASMPSVAGYTTRAQAILDGQAALGLDPIAVTGARHLAGADREIIGGILHHRVRVPPRLSRVRAPLAREAVEMTALGRKLFEIHREAPLELIHAHSPLLCGLPAHAAARRLGLPSVYEIRAFWEDAAADQGKGRERSPRWLAIHALETALCRSADAVVAICDGIRRDLLARGIPDEKIFVVPNGVDTARFTPRPRDEAFAERHGFEGKVVIAYVGSLFRFEGVKLLLDALCRLTIADDRVRGIIVGNGEAEAELRDHHARLGLGDRVVITGRIAPTEIARVYATADVLCYPRESHRITELTTPLKPLEAMSMGKAVVASDVGGMRELVKDGETALCYRAGDLEGLVRALSRAVADEGLREALGTAAREEMIRSRAWSAIVEGYLRVYATARERCARRRGLAAALMAST